jgi:hypothetical protein
MQAPGTVIKLSESIYSIDGKKANGIKAGEPSG